MLMLCYVANIFAQQEFGDSATMYKYRVTLRDKKNNDYSILHPEQYLSAKAIERRNKQGIKIDKTDLPISRQYIETIRDCGVKIIHGSKWNNTLVIATKDTTVCDILKSYHFVTKVELVAIDKPHESRKSDRQSLITNEQEKHDSIMVFGKGTSQISILNGTHLHEMGYRGRGITIAVVDAGFYNVDVIPALKNVNILGVRDFVNPNDDIFAEHNHGTRVLSCMATDEKYVFVGTAPEASFWLLRTEDAYTEQPVEEDNWIAAIEFADSVGVDIINSSLGYYHFDKPHQSLLHKDLNGKTHIISRTASMIAAKGMILCTSAGNEGNDEWKKISIPGDARDVLTVGSVNKKGLISFFSSMGYSADGRVKPDVCALGTMACVLGSNGHTTYANGTSFSSPILTGMVACLWQALPDLNAYEIMEIVRKSGNAYSTPNAKYGNGIPDFMEAWEKGKKLEHKRELTIN